MSPLSVLLVSAEYPPDPGGVGDRLIARFTRTLLDLDTEQALRSAL